MKSKSSYTINLLDILKQQEEMIASQNKLITDLLNENAEKENMINVLMTEFK